MGQQENKILLQKFITNTCSKSEARQVVQMLSSQQDNIEFEALMKELWENTPDQNMLSEEHQLALNETIKSKIVTAGNLERPKVVKMLSARSVAAMIVLLIISGLSVLYFPTYLQKGQEFISQTEASTAEGQMAKVQLADGSTVRLNAQSSIYYPKQFYREDRRGVRLKGEAYFDIAKNKEKPFIIHTQRAAIRVVGTSFNVKEIDSLVVIAVTEGKVVIQPVQEANSESVLLEAGDVGILKSNNTIERIKSDVDNYLSWLSRHLVFRNTSLSAVTQQLEHIYEVDIVLQDPDLKDLSFTGKMKSGFPLI